MKNQVAIRKKIVIQLVEKNKNDKQSLKLSAVVLLISYCSVFSKKIKKVDVPFRKFDWFFWLQKNGDPIEEENSEQM